MELLILILLIISCLCFVVAAFGWVTSAKVNLVALGLALWVLTEILSALSAMT